jgi:6-phosphogluconate dehydrogenase (decarboxylating)
MQLGMIGLGRMGANMVRRLMRDGHECVVHDRSTAATGTAALGETVEAPLEDVKVEWVAPHGTPGVLAVQVQTDGYRLAGALVDDAQQHRPVRRRDRLDLER